MLLNLGYRDKCGYVALFQPAFGAFVRLMTLGRLPYDLGYASTDDEATSRFPQPEYYTCVFRHARTFSLAANDCTIVQLLDGYSTQSSLRFVECYGLFPTSFHPPVKLSRSTRVKHVCVRLEVWVVASKRPFCWNCLFSAKNA